MAEDSKESISKDRGEVGEMNESLTIIKEVGFPIFLVLYYLFIERPRNKKSEDKLAASITDMKDSMVKTIGELKSSITMYQNVEKEISVIREQTKKNFQLFSCLSFENTGYTIKDRIMEIIENNHVEENRETIEKDIETEVSTRMEETRGRINSFCIDEEYKANVSTVIESIIKEMTEEIKNVVFTKYSKQRKKREAGILMKRVIQETCRKII